MGFRLTEFPIVFYDRRQGQSKMSKKIILEAMARVWQLKLSDG
jgi:dolichol-phosphate mannosyltransferase